MSSRTTKFESLLEAVPDALVGMDQAPLRDPACPKGRDGARRCLSSSSHRQPAHLSIPEIARLGRTLRAW